MTAKRFEFKLCSNGYNYLYKNNELYITEKGDYVILEQKGDVVELLNKLHEENQEFIQFKEQVFNLINKKLEENKELDGVDTAMYYANKQTLNELKKELYK